MMSDPWSLWLAGVGGSADLGYSTVEMCASCCCLNMSVIKTFFTVLARVQLRYAEPQP